jgi:hypothetical protein
MPTFILHGMKDEVIGFHHGQELAANSVGKPLVFIAKKDRQHNDMDSMDDLVLPLIEWMKLAKIDTGITY